MSELPKFVGASKVNRPDLSSRSVSMESNNQTNDEPEKTPDWRTCKCGWRRAYERDMRQQCEITRDEIELNDRLSDLLRGMARRVTEMRRIVHRERPSVGDLIIRVAHQRGELAQIKDKLNREQGRIPSRIDHLRAVLDYLRVAHPDTAKVATAALATDDRAASQGQGRAN